MIFVTLGTQDKPFNRLLESLEKQIESGLINDEVVVQAGTTKFKSDKMKVFDLIDRDEFDNYMKKADLLITHGGVGSIITGLKYEKKVIAAPRLAKFGEHVNDHQLQIIKCFEKKHYLLPLYEFDDFHKVLMEVKDFQPNHYESNRDAFISLIEKLIEDVIT